MLKNLKYIVALWCGLFLTHNAFAQPANDDCTGATGMGTLPAPGACIAGLQDGAPVTLTNQSTVNATGENPYTYITNCQGGGDMTNPALDTWYTLVATGTILNINISGFPNASIGVWQGGCGNLTASGCGNIPAGGNGTVTITQTNPGDVFYIQVSGGTPTATDNNFTISADSDIDCDDCLQASNFTATPLPTNGAYAPGQVVTFCYEITEWEQENTNWLHGVQLSFGAGWDGTVTNIVPAASCDGGGTWAYYPGGATSTATGTAWPAGFYYESGGNPGNPGDNFGDNCQGTGLSWIFCFDLTVSAACAVGSDLSVTMNTTGDGESGSWSSPACSDDDESVLPAYMICCDPPITTTVDETCPGDGDGSATVTGQGGTAPYDYVWEDDLGNVIYTDNNNFGASAFGGLTTGSYTITVTDDDGCVQVIDIDIYAGICAACPDYANVATGAPDACGGQLYDFEVLNTGCNGNVVFSVVGDYGSSFANEITWTVTSVLTGNVVASGGPGINNGTFNILISLDPNVEGNVFNFEVFDAFGDGFNGTGGFGQIEDALGNIIAGPVTGNFGAAWNQVFAVNIDISTSTITINTPSGPVVNTIGNCADHTTQLTLDNAFFCTPILMDLPWEIVCDQTGQVISSGIHSVTVYPSIATQASDVVEVNWNPATCQWDIDPQNDCDLLDLGTVFTITPDPTAWPANTCVGGNQDFTVTYIGPTGSPDCCSTGGALVPITYNTTTNIADPIVANSIYGGINNSAYTVIPGSAIGGDATSFDLTIDWDGFCYNPPYNNADETYYVAVWVDGVQIILNGPLNGGGPGTMTIDETDLAAAGVTYNQNSVIEIYMLPNNFWLDPAGPQPQVNTTFNPNANCPNPTTDGEWNMSQFDVIVDATYTDMTSGPAVCTFVNPSPYTCCVVDLPTASNPPNINVECSGGAPAPDPLVVTDETSPCNPVVTFQGDVSDGLSCPETITRTYRVTDDCGNFIDVQQLIIIGDVTPPVLAAPPAAITVDCIGDVPAMTNLSWTDNCDGAGSVAGSDGALVGGACGGTITRTWTYADGCGNSDTETQIITVDDNVAPVFAAPPADITYQCPTDVPAMAGLGWTDNCDGVGTDPGTEVSDGNTCPETITRTWTYTDACGNVATETQVITVHDTQAPVFAAPPADITYQCPTDVPAMAGLGWTDNCDGTGTDPGTEVSDGNTCPETITRTWTYTDACGNVATETQVITVHDTQVPVFAAPPADVTVECIGDVPPMTDLGYTDNCDAPGTVTGTDAAIVGGNCGGTITRTWTYTDACGNNATVNQVITVDDTTPPVFAAPPAAVTVECIGDVPAMTNLGYTDNCDAPGSVGGTDGALVGGACGGTITRTWTYTDVCGNNSAVTQIITIDDTTPPVFAAPPAAVTVECIGDVPPMTNLGYTDNCDAPGSVAGSDGALVGGACGGTITRSWDVSDICGNAATTVTQTITIDDTTPPVFAAPPVAITVECIGDVPAMTNLGYTDNCDAPGSVTGSDGALVGGACGGTITRTWDVSDICGNAAITVTQTITIDDTTPPVFAAPPAAVTVECIGDVPAMTNLGYTDNCDAPGSVAGSDGPLVGGACGGTITRTWDVSDICGNTATTVTQVITIDDTTPPVFAAPPAAVTVECIGDVPPMTDLGYTDNCDAAGTVTGVDGALVGGACGGTITRTWDVSDVCGNAAITVTQVITIDDTTPPVMAAPPADVTVECIGDVPAMINGAYTDNCDAPGTVVGVDVSDGNTCPEVITRTWTYTDACGNSSSVSQTITVDDTTPPTASNPADQVGTPPPFDPTQVTDEADNCGVPTVTDGGDVSDGGNCPEIITRTYIITDACGNTTTVIQTFTIGDAIMPTASNPAPINEECLANVPAPDPLVVTDEADNGTPPVVTWEDDTSDGNTCPEVISRRYRVTDNCGNFIFVTQTITVHDITAPVLAAAPVDAAYQCPADVPAMAGLGWTDNCDGAGTDPGTEVSDGNTCPETITRTWTYTDACGNTATETQVITVHDTQVPVFAAPPVAAAYQCSADVPAMAGLGWTDNCDGAGTDPGTEVSDGNTCPETITRTWTYTDACGNTSTETQVITVHDTQVPVFAAPPAAVTVECIGDVPAMTDLGYTDNCDAPGTVTGTDAAIVGGNCGGTITRTWTYDDACGNNATVTQVITVDDTTPPVMAAPPADVTVECAGDVPAMINGAYTDNCDAPGTVVGVDVSDGNTCPEVITRTWTYTDACGNTSSVSQTITVDDTTPPTATDPATTIVPGGPAPAVDINVVTDEADNCTVAPVVAFVSEVSDGNPCPETITRIYSITDACGNTATVTHIIQITDPFPPTASNPLPINVECIGDVPVPDVLVVTDEADNQGVPVVAYVGDVSDGNTCPEVITRTYSVTDLCGTVITVDQTITINDITPPTASNPVAVNVECIFDVPATDVTVVTDEADNCTAAPVVAWVGDVSDGNTCPEVITRTYSITDDCGNQITVDQTITVDDITPPTASNPLPVNVECIFDVPATDIFVVTDEADNCTAAPVVAWVGDVSDGNTCPEVITRTYSITDDCGNVTTVDQTITVDDITDPTATDPATTTVPGGPVPPVDITVVTDEADNCTAAPVVAFVSEVSDGNPCPETITRIYSVTDDCGNQITVTHLIVITDPIMPTASNPLPENVECIFDVSAPDVTVVTDEADNQGVPVVAWVGDVSDGNTCPEVITRTYSVTDVCGNQITVDQIITVNDITPPTASNPVAVNVECIFDVPATDITVVTDEADNCTAAPVVAWVGDVSDGNTCPEVITRTYSITDDCGNQITVDQTITVNDVTPPTASNPLSVNVECIFDVPATDITVVTDEADNCTAAPVVAWVGDVSDGNTCPEVITRTYSITDDCGNQITVDQTITVNDVTPPTASNPIAVNVECIGDVPATDITVVTDEADNCTAAPVVVWVGDVSDGNTCPEVITRTYSITDDCGNQITVDQTITVNDITDPTASNPIAVNVECIGDVPATDITVVTDEADNCTAAPIVAWVGDVSDGNTCPEVITRTYSITDDCGNQITVDQTITVNDITPPTASNPVAVNVECIGDVPATDITVVTDEADNCTAAPIVAWVGDVSDGNTCPEVITRTYSITDDCGNVITVDQIITVDDITPPTASNPIAVNVECIGDVPATDILVVTDEADNCTVAPIVTWVGDVSDGNSCPEVITRTYSITDDCGNQITVDQTITVNDITPPTASDPVDISVPGANDVPAPDPLDVIDELDNCTLNPVVVWVSDVSDGNVCNLEEITRTYSVTDDCGNQILVTQIITILAVPAPIDAGPDQTICVGENVVITADNPLGVPIAWNPSVAQPLSPAVTTTYTVTADNLGCISTDDVTIIVEPLPVVSFSGDVLSGCEPLTVTFTNSTPGNIVDCVWDIEGAPSINGCGPIVYTFENGGTYDVTLTTTSSTGCTNSVTYTDYIYVEDLPVASFSPSTTELLNIDTEVDFLNTSIGATSYLWDFGDNTATSTIENPTHMFPEENSGSYVVELIAYSPLGCTDTAWMTINVSEELIFWVPNTFTPDGDNYNEYFQAIFTSGYDPYDFSLFIFNRWGEIVWESHDDEIGWDGTYGGKLVQDGTYTWKIEFKTSETDERISINGHVNIIR